MKDTFDELLSAGLKNKSTPSESLHNQIMNMYSSVENKSGNVKTKKYRRFLTPVLASLLVCMVLFSGINVYASVKNMTLAELFENMWGNENDETLSKVSGNYKIVSEKCNDDKIDISMYDCVYDSGKMYLVLMMRGKEGGALPDDLLVYSYNVDIPENKSCPYTYDVYALKKENGDYYFALEFTTDPTIKETTINLHDISLAHGEVGADGRAISYGDLIGFVDYSLRLKATSDMKHIKIDVNGVEYRITSLGIYANMGDFDMIEKAAYDSENCEWIKENACVILKGNKKVYFYPSYGSENCSGYYLSNPIETDDVIGMKIGENIFYVE